MQPFHPMACGCLGASPRKWWSTHLPHPTAALHGKHPDLLLSGELSGLWVSDVSTWKRCGKEEFLKRELFAPPCLTMPHSWLLPWATVGSGRWPGTAWSQHVDLPLSPLLRDGGQVAYRDTLGCWVHGEDWGRSGDAFPLVWGGGSLFSVPAVFLLFNLNTQPLHHSCIPQSGRGLQWWLGPPEMTRGSRLISIFTLQRAVLSLCSWRHW